MDENKKEKVKEFFTIMGFLVAPKMTEKRFRKEIQKEIDRVKQQSEERDRQRENAKIEYRNKLDKIYPKIDEYILDSILNECKIPQFDSFWYSKLGKEIREYENDYIMNGGVINIKLFNKETFQRSIDKVVDQLVSKVISYNFIKIEDLERLLKLHTSKTINVLNVLIKMKKIDGAITNDRQYFITKDWISKKIMEN